MTHAELFRVRVDGSEKTITFSPQHINDIGATERLALYLGELMDENQTTSDPQDSFETLNLDFQEIAWISSAGLNQLIGINRQARSRGIRLVLTNVQQSVREVFAMTRLERMFEVSSQ